MYRNKTRNIKRLTHSAENRESFFRKMNNLRSFSIDIICFNSLILINFLLAEVYMF